MGRDGMDGTKRRMSRHDGSIETARTKVLERTKQRVRTRELGELGTLVATGASAGGGLVIDRIGRGQQ